MTNPPIEMVELEGQLRQDKDGSRRDAVCQELLGRLAELKREMDSGLAPAEFEQAQRVKAALEACLAVVPKVWNSMHAKA